MGALVCAVAWWGRPIVRRSEVIPMMSRFIEGKLYGLVFVFPFVLLAEERGGGSIRLV